MKRKGAGRIAKLERAVRELTARVETLENGTRPKAMPLGDLMAERLRFPINAFNGNPSQTPSHGTGGAD